MASGFELSTKFDGSSGDYVRVTALNDLVLIRAVDTMIVEAATVAMTPAQARALAAGIAAATEKAEGKQ